MSARWDEKNTRKIVRRLVITGTLTMITPARFGGGEGRSASGKVTDMPLARDPVDGTPLLTGASIAGALRSYLREWELGYEKPADDQDGLTLTQTLFGDVLEDRKEPESRESWLIVEDSRATSRDTETRPGVAIDPKSRTAKIKEEGGFLYDMELLEAGTQFPLHIELAIPDNAENQRSLLEGLAIALTGFECGEIGLGTRKRRGLGECEVKDWQVGTFDLRTPPGLIAWLEGGIGTKQTGKPIADLLNVTLPLDQRRRFTMETKFRLDGSLLIRSGSEKPDAPDMVHLKSRRNGTPRPILSGTSLAGALRSRALRIANITAPAQAERLVAEIFGPAEIKQRSQRKKGEEPKASRAVVYEREIANESERVQSRVKIDRFTGGSFPGALFDQQPVMGRKGDTPHLVIKIELRQPEKAHIGLLLHLLKDLWTGDLPLGGEASVGRGRLKGVKATLEFHSPNADERGQWTIISAGVDNVTKTEKLNIKGPREKLEAFAQAVGGVK